MLNIREYSRLDAKATWELFFQTVRNINLQHYSKKQVEAWASESIGFDNWEQKMESIQPFIVELDGKIVAYADLQKDGKIDHFFCHHKYQGQGVGKFLMSHILNLGKKREVKRYYSEVSITARAFFEYFGFEVVTEQHLSVRGQKLTNFLMQKNIYS